MIDDVVQCSSALSIGQYIEAIKML